jgi:hypothetical protein
MTQENSAAGMASYESLPKRAGILKPTVTKSFLKKRKKKKVF